jgi:hypothetical protein
MEGLPSGKEGNEGREWKSYPTIRKWKKSDFERLQ